MKKSIVLLQRMAIIKKTFLLLLVGLFACYCGLQAQTPSGTVVAPKAVIKPVTTKGVSPKINGGTIPAVTYNAGVTHSVSGVIPDGGPKGTSVVISGKNFGNNMADVQVKFNGIAAIINGLSDNQISAVVPDRAGPGPITVVVKGKAFTGSYFNYKYTAVETTLAGITSGGGFADGAASNARFDRPAGMAIDRMGNIYVADANNHRIRIINQFGEVTTLAGSGERGFADGNAQNAKFNYPVAVAVDATGNVFVSDKENNRVRKITPGGMVSTLAGSGTKGKADGNGSAASFNYLSGITTDAAGNVYVCDESRIRKITPAGSVTSFAGTGRNGNDNGAAATATFLNPRAMVFSGGNMYISDGYYTLRKINAAGVVSNVVGSGRPGGADGYYNAAQFYGLEGIAADAKGDLYVCDVDRTDGMPGGSKIRKIFKDGNVITVAEGVLSPTIFMVPSGLVIDAAGAIYVSDRFCIRKIVLQ